MTPLTKCFQAVIFISDVHDEVFSSVSLCPYDILDELFSGRYALMTSLTKCFQAAILISDIHDEVFSGRYAFMKSVLDDVFSGRHP